MTKWKDIIEAVEVLGVGDDWPNGADHDVIWLGGPGVEDMDPKYIQRDGEDGEAKLLGLDGRELGVHWSGEYDTWTCYV